MEANNINTINCPGCNLQVPFIHGKPHEYIGATQGCWDFYCKVLEKEYGEYNYPELTHRLTVDTYAIQHPGVPSRKAIQSVNVHLVSLYFIIKKSLNGKQATLKMSELLSNAPKFKWLEPPTALGEITIKNVLEAKSKNEHINKVRDWAEYVWNCWYAKHAVAIEKIINQNFKE